MPIIPPIKSQGIKTKLVDWIGTNLEGVHYDRWVEPFMGTGVVAFNIRPPNALLCDSNPHLINFYQAIQNKEITGLMVREFLTKEGQKLLDSEGEYYYTVRERFNQTASPLDFLFLNRSCFNGMMRFNKKGGFNVPFCRKPNRFAQALVTRITNQVDCIAEIIAYSDYNFRCQDFQTTLSDLQPSDLVYADPPYIGRHVDYYDSWTDEEETLLNHKLKESGCQFVLSTWLSNKYRTNNYIFSLWKDSFIATKEHFYHVGAKEANRNAVYEAILSNIKLPDSVSNSEMFFRIDNKLSQLTTENSLAKKQEQLTLQL